jgi:hypothetical protein
VKVIAVLMLVGAAVFVAAHTDIDFSFHQGTDAAASGTHSAEVQEVLDVVAAGTNVQAERDGRAMRQLLDHASAHGLRRRGPAIARRLDHDTAVLHGAVTHMNVSTTIGRDCQLRTLGFLARQRRLLRRFVTDLASRTAAAAARRLSTESARLQQWYGHQLDACIADASPDDRAALQAALFNG